MKKIKPYPIALAFTFLAFACHEDESYTKTRIIENQTSFDVTIDVFDEGEIVQNLTIDANQSSEATSEC